MPEPFATVGDLMVRSPVIAEDWQPISFVRQAMLTNSFSYLPLFIEGRWKLLSDFFIARYLQKAESKSQRRALMARSVAKVVQESTDLQLSNAFTVLDTDLVADVLKSSTTDEASGFTPGRD